MRSTRTNIGRRPAAAALLAGAMLLLGFGASAGAEDIYVKKAEVTIRAGKAAYTKAVATAKAGDRLTVIEKAPGDWYHVEAPGGKRGWVHALGLSSRPIEFADAKGRFGGAGAEQGKRGNVGRGEFGRGAFVGNFVNPDGSVSVSGHGWEAAAFGTAKNLDATGLRRIKEARGRAADKAASFIAEGKLGRAE